MQPKIGFAFGGGGVRGFAHIGAIRVLEDAGIKADFVAGTSAGALVASLYACGYTGKMMADIVQNINFSRLVRLKFSRLGMVQGDEYTEFIRLCTKNKNIEDANIPLRLVAVDLYTGERVVLDKGNIAIGVRASSSIPGVFTPVKYNGMMLTDGGMLDACPDSIVREMGADIVIAINLRAGGKQEPKNIVDVLTRSIEIVSNKQTLTDADVVLEPISIPFDSPIGVLDFHKGQEYLKMGEAVAREKLAEIKKVIADYQNK